MFEVEIREKISRLIGEALASGWSITHRETYIALCAAFEKLATAERR